MASSDVHADSGAPLAEPVAGRRRPEIINLPPSFDLGKFLSEEELPVSASPVPPTDTVDVNPAVVATRVDAEIQAPPLTSAPALDFPWRPPVEVSGPVEPGGNPENFLTLLQLRESGGHFTWQEAVAIVEQLCVQLKDIPSHAPVLIEPGAIQVTAAGQLHLLASQQGGDPLVIQLGRLLRSLLSTEGVPSELRLLVSQATFELAIFDSVDQFARALAKISGPVDPDSVEAAFRRAAESPLDKGARPPAEARVVSRPILPEPALRASRTPKTRRPFDVPGLLARVGVTAAVVAGIALAAFRISRNSEIVSTDPATTQEIARPEAPPQIPASIAATPDGTDAITPPAGIPKVDRSARSMHGGGSFVRTEARPPAEPSAPTVPSLTSPLPPPATATATARSPSDLVHQAAALFRDGKPADAGILLDLLVLTAPLYEPSVADLTTDGSLAFRKSQRLLLPKIAARDLDKAVNALNSGDADRALILGDRVATMLGRFDVDSSSPLRSTLEHMLRGAGAAQLASENIVYGRGDTDVVPPQPLSRQFPQALPSGVPPPRVGTLELIVGKVGDVEFVKLYTPLNRYHERMIVSAVKAWRYRPALKAGKPVRFRLTISINLPESGNGSILP